MPFFHGPELVILLLSAFWIWMLIDCLLNKTLTGSQKILWLLLIFFTHILGAILYFAIGRTAKRSQPQTTNQKRQEPYQPYLQGYQTQREVAPYQESVQPSHSEQSQHERYEQPQASYPEPPQENTH